VKRTYSKPPPAASAQGGTPVRIQLAPAAASSGLGDRGSRKRWRIVRKRHVAVGSLLVNDDALMVEARALLRGRLEVPLGAVRKAVIDDGSRWGYVASVCRFPVYDFRSDGSGSGTLIGPLWSHASSLMPAGCPVASLDPVPDQAPNLVLIFEPAVPMPSPRDGIRQHPSDPDKIVGLLLRVEDPDAIRAALASRIEIGDIEQEDLAYLAASAGPRPSRNGSRSGNGRRQAAVSKERS
jgi:hypothetical protein